MDDSSQNTQSGAQSRAVGRRSSPIIERNVRALIEHAAAQERDKSTGDRIAIGISRFAGSMKSVYVHAVIFGTWASAYVGWLPGVPNFDRDLIALNTLATVEAIFLATFVLIAQNRMVSQAGIQNHLDVQVSLLTEHETTHILRLVAAMGEKMGITEAHDPEIAQLIRSVETQEMLDQIEVNTETVAEEIRTEADIKRRGGI